LINKWRLINVNVKRVYQEHRRACNRGNKV
jgi:hypothetical protein